VLLEADMPLAAMTAHLCMIVEHRRAAGDRKVDVRMAAHLADGGGREQRNEADHHKRDNREPSREALCCMPCEGDPCSFPPHVHSAAAEWRGAGERISMRAWRITCQAPVRPRTAITAATTMSGQCVPESQTPTPARITAILAMQSLRVQSHTERRLLSPRRCRNS
jgi:hypothetical protein